MKPRMTKAARTMLTVMRQTAKDDPIEGRRYTSTHELTLNVWEDRKVFDYFDSVYAPVARPDFLAGHRALELLHSLGLVQRFGRQDRWRLTPEKKR